MLPIELHLREGAIERERMQLWMKIVLLVRQQNNSNKLQ